MGKKQGNALEVETSTNLPYRNGGDGGADVQLGKSKNTVWCTDRTSGNGKLYYYRYSTAQNKLELASSYETGRKPRYMTVLKNNDIVTCNKDDATFTVFKGLASNPTSTPQKV